MSTWLDVTLTTEQDFSLGTGGARAYLTRTHPYVPGSVLRGALAAAWLASGGSTDETFRTLWDGGVRFGPCFPEGAFVEPQSAVRCKYHEASAGHREYVDEAFGPRPAGCAGGWERLKGATVSAVRPKMRPSSAQRPGTILVESGQLFAYETLPRGTLLRGRIVVPDGVDWAPLAELGRIFVGARTHSLGRTRVAITRGTPPEPHEGATLRTLTPTILVDAAGRPTTDLAGVLERDFGLTVDSTRCWADRLLTEGVGGWHQASSLPKPSDVALAPGATFGLVKPSKDAVRRLLEAGLGLRRTEGYGWVAPASDPSWGTSADDTVLARPAALAQALALNLTKPQRAWLAHSLRAVPPGAKSDADKALDLPAAGWLSAGQHKAARELLLTADARGRHALAAWIERGMPQ